MKKINTLLLISLFFFPIFLLAQAPGYLGKKGFLSLTVSSLPAINGPTQNNRGGDFRTFGTSAGRLGFNYEFEGSFSYVIGRYRTISINAAQYYTGATHSAQTLTSGTVFDPFSFNELDDHDLFSRLNVKSITLRVSKFNASKGALAPVGNRIYYGLKRSFISSNIVDKETRYYNELGELFGHQKIELEQKMNLNFFQLGWSNDQVFWDKVILSMGIRFNIPLNIDLIRIAYEDKSYDPNYSTNPNQTDYDVAVFSRVFNHEIFRVNIGVGFLLF